VAKCHYANGEDLSLVMVMCHAPKGDDFNMVSKLNYWCFASTILRHL